VEPYVKVSKTPIFRGSHSYLLKRSRNRLTRPEVAGGATITIIISYPNRYEIRYGL
jgi:hypothetical protein